MRSIMLVVTMSMCLALGPGPALAQGGAPAAAAAQEKAREFLRLREQVRVLFGQKKYAEGAEVCRQMIALVPQAAESHYNLACALVHLEKKDEALAALAKAADAGFADAALMEKDEDLASLRSEPRYRELLAKVKANDEAQVEKGQEIPGVKTVEGAPEGGLRYRLRLSPAATKAKPDRLIVWMHPAGGSMNANVEPLSPRFIQRGFALVVLTKKDFRFWSADDAARLAKTLDAVARIDGISDDRPVLMGFSAGGQMALELWSANPAGLGGLVLDAAYPVRMVGGKAVAMALPANEAARKVPMFVLVGTKDGGSQIWKQVEQPYRQAGVPLSILYLDGRGHEWLFGANELEALEKWLGELAAAPPAQPAPAVGWRPGAVGGNDVTAPQGLVRFADSQASVTVPVQRGGHLLFAEVAINGRKAGWFVVDTGGQVTMVGRQTATDLGLPVTGQGMMHAMGGSRPVAFRQVDAMAVGDLAVGSHRVIEQDLKALCDAVGVPLGGVLGATLWTQVPFTVDYDAATVTFHNPALFKPPAGAKAEKLEVTAGRPAIRATLGGKHEGLFAIDTAGTRFLYLDAPFVKQNPDLVPAVPVRTITHFGPMGPVRLGLADLKSLTVLGRTFANVQVQYSPGRADKADEQAPAGSFGAPMLEQFRLTYDYPNKMVYIEPRKNASLKERLAAGLKVTDRDLRGFSPLYQAAGDGAKADVAMLLAAKADPNAADTSGRTPLHAAAASGGEEIVRMLLAKGADVKAKAKDGKTPLYVAAENDQTGAAQAFLVAHSDAKAADANGATVLMQAALNGNAVLVKQLLKAGADAEAKTADEKTTLMAAAQSDSAEVIRTLVDAKADVNTRDRQGGTALMFATFTGKAAAVEALIAAKADVNIQTHAGESALHIAKARKLPDIVAILEKAGAKE